MDVWITVILCTMSYELLFSVEAPVTDVRLGNGTLLAVPDVETAWVFDCFVVAPFCVVVEGRAAGFGDCANVSDQVFSLILRHSIKI